MPKNWDLLHRVRIVVLAVYPTSLQCFIDRQSLYSNNYKMTAACNNKQPTYTDNINMLEISMKSSPSSPPNANHVSKPMEPFCWRIPFVASLLLMILLGSATLLSNRDVHSLGVAHSSHHVEDSFPLNTRESGGMTHVMQHSLKIWTGSVIKTVLIEVGAMALFQSVGMLPTLTKILMAGRKVKPAWIRLLMQNSKNSAHVVRQMSTGGLRSPRLVRRLGQFVQNVYKRRSRLSTASDFLNIVGDDDKDETADIAP